MRIAHKFAHALLALVALVVLSSFTLAADPGIPFFNVCLQDDLGGDTLQFNTFTGNYKYTRCSDGLMLSGKGEISRIGCEIRLEDGSRVSASIGECTASIPQGKATIRFTIFGPTCSIKDSNRFNNLCICPPKPCSAPRITTVGLIPIGKKNPDNDFYRGPSSPGGATPEDDGPPLGPPVTRGDHPFGGETDIRGNVFLIPDAFQYKVEFATDPVGGPWTLIRTEIEEFIFDEVTGGLSVDIRKTDIDGWYSALKPDSLKTRFKGVDLLTEWLTNAPGVGVSDGLYYLRLTVRDSKLRECVSPRVPIIIDNTVPVLTFKAERLSPGLPPLDLCVGGEVHTGDLIRITLKATDNNFSQLRVQFSGCCKDLMDVKGREDFPPPPTTRLSTEYGGDITNTGVPLKTFIIDPADFTGCEGRTIKCFQIEADVFDRAVVNNTWYQRHSFPTQRVSITILP